MKIVCPSCEATYEVPEIVMTSRRKMRCARCGTEWVPADMQDPAAGAAWPGDAPPAANPAAMPDLAQAAAPQAAQTPEPMTTDHAELGLAVLVPDEPVAEPDLPEPVMPAQPVALRPETPVTVTPVTLKPEAAAAPVTSPVTKQVPPPAPGVPFLAWSASIALVIVALAAGVLFRTPLMKAWPPSQRLYAALGMAER